MSHIMLDLETFGTKPGSVIVAIGAVKMDFDKGTITDQFYRTIDAANAQSHGLTIDANTVLWWLMQSTQARERLIKDKARLPTALLEFSTWAAGCTTIWGNGSDFDIVLLGCAYDACGLPAPWTYRNVRCYRTIKNRYPAESLIPGDRGVTHDALADAIWQAEHLINIQRNAILGRVEL